MIRTPYEWFCAVVLIVAVAVLMLRVVLPIICFVKSGCNL